jgi:UPF0271 protein
MKQIDINCDMGEGTGNDAALMPFISSCSIACGGHFGNLKTIAATLGYAQASGVQVGAHPSYPDQLNFGRKSIPISLPDLQDALRKQLDLFFSLCSHPNHIKPHGALYNDLFHDIEKARAVVTVFGEYSNQIKLFCSPGSQLAAVAVAEGFQVVFEGFGDRAYTPLAGLVSRSKEGAVLTHKEEIAQQVFQLVTKQHVNTLDHQVIPLEVQTICLHGDGKNVVENLQYLKDYLINNGISVKAI